MKAVAQLGVVCDFDGTITMEDTATGLLDMFGPPGWRFWEEEYLAGRVTDQESVIGAFATLSMPIPRLVEWVLENAQVRPGAPEFFAWFRSRGVPITVASNGLDFYITPFLAAHRLEISELLAGRGAEADDRICVSYEHLRDLAYPEEQDLKRLAVKRMKDRGLTVVYIGDGSPDYPAAAIADIIFARRRLLDLCQADGVPCYPFEVFADILAVLDLPEVWGIGQGVRDTTLGDRVQEVKSRTPFNATPA